MATLKGGRPSDPVRQLFLKLDGSKTKCVIYNNNNITLYSTLFELSLPEALNTENIIKTYSG